MALKGHLVTLIRDQYIYFGMDSENLTLPRGIDWFEVDGSSSHKQRWIDHFCREMFTVGACQEAGVATHDLLLFRGNWAAPF